MRVVAVVFAAVGLVCCPAIAKADGTCAPGAVTTWGVGSTTVSTAPAATPPVLDSPVARARDLLARAKILDDQAASDDRASVDIAAHLPALRLSAKSARDRADHATGDDREELTAKAEDLEADVIVSEAEVISRKRAAADNRQTAAALRARAIHIVREGAADTTSQVTSSCDPPFRYTNDGRKVYRVECFR